MIVQCPSCASRYRIRDANIPPSGGKIRCPSCSHSFIVYPEANDEEDKTNITSQGEISQLINKMGGQSDKASLAAGDEDYVSTQISASDEGRAMAALANELGDPMDMDGTVEIQNPMKVWKEAQNALGHSRGANTAPPDDVTGDDYDDFAATEVVDPSQLNFPAHQGQQQNELPPTAEVSQAELAAAFGVDQDRAAQRQQQQQQRQPPPQNPQQPPQHRPQYERADSSPGVDYGSGQYAPNTPPGGRQTGESWEQPQHGHPGQQPAQQQPEQAFAQEQQPGFGQPNAPRPGQQHAQGPQSQFGDSHGFERSPSGLSSAELFDEPIPDDDPAISQAGYTAPPAQQPPPGGMPQQHAAQMGRDGGADSGHPGPWKLKTNFGLTYEFPDTKGLRSWLSSREELDGFTVSADDGATFQPLSAFEQLLQPRTNSSSGVAPMQPPSYGSGSFDRPSSSGQWQMGDSPPSGLGEAHSSGLHDGPSSQIRGPKVNTEYRPPSRESKGKGLLWLVFLILFGAAIVIGLETFGIFKVTDVARDLGILPAQTESSPKGDTKPTADNAQVDDVDPEELAKKQAAETERLLEDAQRLVEGNKLPAALERLKTTEQLAPDHPMVFDLRAQVFDKLGKTEEASAARARADELRGIGGGPDAGTADGGDVEAGENPGDEAADETAPDKAE